MNRMSVRLFLSHVLVALVGGLTSYVIVRTTAPALFDSGMREMGQMGRMGQDRGALQESFSAAVNSALLVGLLASLLAAALAGAYAAYRTLGPLRDVRQAARRIAQGRYDEQVARPREVELAALADDVNTMAGVLGETERRRVRLLSELAHEMRTPLTVIDGYVEGLVDGVFEPTPEVLGEIGAEVRRLTRLSDDLSALSRAEEGRLELADEPVDLAEVATSTVRRLGPQLADAGIRWEVVAGGSVPVRGDEQRLAQVVTNLVGNAIRAMPGGGTLVVEPFRSESLAGVRLIDSGVGLRAADLERVFERFYRGAASPSAGRDGGSGIGLTISRSIMRAHHGDLTAASPGVGQGATLTLTMPLAALTMPLAAPGGGPASAR